MANNGKLVAALLLGAAAGATLGVLYAPEKGSETRRRIAGRASELGEEISDRISRGKEAVTNLKDRVTGKVDEMRSSGNSRSEEYQNSTEAKGRTRTTNPIG
jgi:gas vesicle protein